MPFFCWADEFVYHQCCDRSYGNHGLELCFADTSSPLSFEVCCPKPNFDDLFNPELHNELAESPWQHAPKKGCDAELYWLPDTLTSVLLSRSNYHSRTGEVSPVNWNSTLGGMKQGLERHLSKSKDFSLRAFIRSAMQYYLAGDLDFEMLLMKSTILTIFGHVLLECPQAAFLASFLKVEELFHRERTMAVELKGWMTTLLNRAFLLNRVRDTNTWAGNVALKHLDNLAQMEIYSGRATVDLVVPLCSMSDIASLTSSLIVTLNNLHDLWHLTPQNIKAVLRLHLYDICGLMVDGVTLVSSHISEKLFAELSEKVLPCFDAETSEDGALAFPHIRITELDEEVPTGDASAYLHHLAQIADRKDIADVSIFLHPDFAEHIRVSLLQHIFGSLISGSWPLDAVDFLYLGWRHDGVTGGGRVASTLQPRCIFANGQIRRCLGSPSHPLAKTVVTSDFVGFNPVLLSNLWYRTFGWPLNSTADDFGGYDFSQLLVSRRAVQSRPPSYWQYLSCALSARSSFELLPGTKFISNRVDLTPSHGFNKGVCIWFEHMWHLLLDVRFHPEERYVADTHGRGQDLRAFTRLADKALPLFLRTGPSGPDNMMLRHFLLTPAEQCNLLEVNNMCTLAAWQATQHQA